MGLSNFRWQAPSQAPETAAYVRCFDWRRLQKLPTAVHQDQAELSTTYGTNRRYRKRAIFVSFVTTTHWLCSTWEGKSFNRKNFSRLNFRLLLRKAKKAKNFPRRKYLAWHAKYEKYHSNVIVPSDFHAAHGTAIQYSYQSFKTL